jgi:CNT family concentrative nucleoside transporter
MLNAISAVGLLTMLLLAWLMSSHKNKVDWRLVIFGVLLQLALAALFFNSQNWKFPREFTQLENLVEACETGGYDAASVPKVKSAEEFAVLLAEYQDRKKAYEDRKSEAQEKAEAFTEAEVTLGDLRTRFWEPSGNSVSVPRFKNGIVFYWIESFFDVIQRSVEAGSTFVFDIHAAPDDVPKTHPRALIRTFAFGILPTVVFFAALMSVLYYCGFMQKLIRMMAWVMEKTLRTTPAESLAAAANVLVGHTEAPLVVKPYVSRMTRSELNALMVGGFSTISGSLMAIFAGMGVSAGHLLTASLISAPAALVLAKIMQPETETPVPLEESERELENEATNIIEAAANGASEGVKLAINIAAMLIAFLGLIMFVDILLSGIGSWFGLDLSLSRLFGLLFYPLAFIMGIEQNDCMTAGDLLGKKMVVNEFLAYIELSGASEISDRTRTILTYALCGFSNFGAIGIQLGGIGPLAPERKGDLAQLGLRAMLGGMLAACMTACIAGMMYGML